MGVLEAKSDPDNSSRRKPWRSGTAGSLITSRSALEEIDLRNLWRTIWRWRKTVLLIIAGAIVAGLVAVKSLTPIYTATTQVAIGPREAQVVDLPAVLASLTGDAETIATEVAVIRSRKLAQKTVVQLGLDTHPEFQRTPGALQRLLAWAVPEPVLRFLGGSELPTRDPDARMVDVVERFLEKLKVSTDGKSRVVTIAFQSADPALAAQIANTIADFYIVSQLDAKFEATRRANEWLSTRLEGLRQETLASENAVESFRREKGLIRGQVTTIATQEVSQLATDLVAARAKRIEAQSRLAQIRSGAAAGGRSADWASVPEVLQNQLIQKLREQEVDAERRAADLLQQFGEKHPRVINVRGEIREIRSKIQAEVAKIIDALRSEAAIQQAREASLSAMLDQLKGDVSENNVAEVQLRDLERTAEANRALYENFLQRFKETQTQDRFQQPDANVISAAVVPADPTFPQTSVFVILSALAGALLGALLALVAENLDVGVRSSEQLKQVLGVHPLGLVPNAKGSGRGSGPERDILDRPASAYAEAIRTVHTNLVLSDVDHRAEVVLVTSSLPGEGKSTLAASLAHMAARYGDRVILVDCDLRRPRLHRVWGVPQEPGVADWLLNRRELDEIISATAPDVPHLIPAGRLPSTPPNLLGSDRFRKMLNTLRNSYDLVILDSAPVLSIADTRALAAFADKTLFVVQWASTSRKVAANALECLAAAGADVAGAVLTRVNVRSHAKDGFSDSVLYAGKLKEYYR
jgi:exopolysaccharide transport family protein